jgi:opacity protein-like surface antigen
MVLVLWACGPSADAHADWLLTPFLGGAFAGKTTFNDLERGAESAQLVMGGSGAWLTDGLLGVEVDFAYAPRYFERDNRAGLVSGSNVITLSGSLIATMPLSVTRESLRPYIVGGVGLMHAAIRDVAGLFSERHNIAALNAGGGAIGFVSPDVGVRFDLRYLRSLSRDDDPVTLTRRSKLSFWRATVGVTIRY